MTPVVAIVGRPNVGKSTIFNRIVGERKAITDDQPGATRDRLYGKAIWLGHNFNLIDTGGIEISDAPFLSQIKIQAEIAIRESQVVIFVVDGKSGVTPDDHVVMQMLHEANKPVVVAVNKADNQSVRDQYYEFYELGAADIIPISGTHGIGIGDLLDKVTSLFPESVGEEYPEATIKFSIIGRPNVGKSQLTNAILGYDRVIVSSEQGTTTDSVDTMFVKDEQNYVVIDTAGLRKRGKIYESLERYGALRAMQAIDRSDVCLVVIDADQGIIEQDKHVAGYATDSDKAIVLVVNKYDLVAKDNNTIVEWEKRIRQEFKFLSYAPIVFLSAKTKSRVKTLFPAIEKAFENYSRRVSTSVLNEVINEAVLLNPPKEHNHKQIKIYYATQVKERCPTFVLFVNYTDAMHFSYHRYLENRIRERFDFEGTPIKIILRNRE